MLHNNKILVLARVPTPIKAKASVRLSVLNGNGNPYPPKLQTKVVEIEEGKEIEITPDAGFDGLAKVIITTLSTCFSTGYWRNDKAWSNTKAWNNY